MSDLKTYTSENITKDIFVYICVQLNEQELAFSSVNKT